MAFGLMRLLLAGMVCTGAIAAVVFGHPPARCARVPLRGAKGGSNGVLCFSLDSRVRGNDGAVRGNDWISDGLVSMYPIENDGGRINA